MVAHWSNAIDWGMARHQKKMWQTAVKQMSCLILATKINQIADQFAAFTGKGLLLDINLLP